MQRKKGQFASKEASEELESASPCFNSSEGLQDNTLQVTE